MQRIFREMMRKNGKLTLSFAVLVVFISIVTGIFLGSNESKTWYGYVVGEDKRIYMVNLDTGKLEWMSRKFDQIGDPTHIEINRTESVIYIASDRGRWQWTYVPLIAVKLNDSADVVFETYLYPEYAEGDTNVPATYDLILNPNGKALYASIAHEYFPERRTVLSPESGKILGQTEARIEADWQFSADGERAARLFPRGSRLTEEGVEEWKSGINIWDLQSGEHVSFFYLEDDQGMQPPWGSQWKHYIYGGGRSSEGTLRIQVYDAVSGDFLASHNLHETIGIDAHPSQTYPTRIPGSEDVVMSVGDSVILFDPVTAEIKNKAYIGDFFFTEVVVSDKPIVDVVTGPC